MTDLRKAAEMALEALETLWDILDDIDTASDMAKENDAWYRKRVEALQKKRWDTMITTDGYKLKGGPVEALRQVLAQPEQEPVTAHQALEALDELESCARGDEPFNHFAAPLVRQFIEQAVVLPKKEWVGLTDNEARKFYEKYTNREELIYAIDEFLEEKNNG